jgi:hypothetical protein
MIASTVTIDLFGSWSIPPIVEHDRSGARGKLSGGIGEINERSSKLISCGSRENALLAKRMCHLESEQHEPTAMCGRNVSTASLKIVALITSPFSSMR